MVIPNKLNYTKTKIIIGSISVLITAFMEGRVSAEENKTVIETKGSANFQGIILPKNEPDFINDEDKYQSWRMGNGGSITIKYKQKIEEKVTIGAVSKFALSTGFNSELSTSELYIFMDSDSGKFELGSRRSAAEELKIDATNIQAQNIGIDTNWYRSANLEGKDLKSTPFYILPLLYGDYTRTAGPWERSSSYSGSSDSKDHSHKVISGISSPKITYYTPTFNNFKLGLSYTRKERIVNSGKSKGDYKDVLSGGISFEEEISDNVTLKLALTGEQAKHEVPDKYFDLLGWNVGGQISYAGVKAAASFANIGKSGQLIKNLIEDNQPSSSSGDTTYWTLGAAYEVGPAMVSMTYFQSIAKTRGQDKEDILTNLSLGAHYHITGKANKFTPYIGINMFDTKQAGASQNNKGTIFTTGLQVTF